MHGFVRLVTTLIAAAFFAVASVAWATAGAGPQQLTMVAVIDHVDHGDPDTDVPCVDAEGCADVADHHHEADSTCCAFACHVVADVASMATSGPGRQAGQQDPTDAEPLFGTLTIGPERPPRAA